MVIIINIDDADIFKFHGTMESAFDIIKTHQSLYINGKFATTKITISSKTNTTESSIIVVIDVDEKRNYVFSYFAHYWDSFEDGYSTPNVPTNQSNKHTRKIYTKKEFLKLFEESFL